MNRSAWQMLCGGSDQDPASEAILLCGGSLMCLAMNLFLWAGMPTDDIRFWVALVLDGGLAGIFLVGVGMFIEIGLRKWRGRKAALAHG